MLATLSRRGTWTVDALVRAHLLPVAIATTPTVHLTEPVRHAIETGCPVTICYADAMGRVSERIIDPLWANSSYLIGYCRLVRGQRTFRLDRTEDAWVS